MSRSRTSRLLGIGLLAACVTACGLPEPAEPTPKAANESESPPPQAPAEDLRALADGNNAFAIDLYKKLAETEKGNIVVSPYSIRTALAMTYAGARGRTAEEMRKVLHFTLPDEKLHPAFGATAHQLTGGKDKPFTLNVANALWGQQGYPFRPEFLDLTRKNYAGGFREVDFAANLESARQTINRWVEEKTQDKIKELLKRDTVTDKSRLVLVNALYFKGQWEHPFDARLTTDDKFRVTPERTVPVRMMNQRGKFGYTETDDAQLLRLPYRPYRESGLAMLVVLPKAVDGLARLESGLSGPQIQKWFGSMLDRRGQVFLPTFRGENEYSLKPHLTGLGMRLPFTSQAEFSGIVPPDESLLLDDVVHKAMVEVNEEGTVAAATTAVVGMQPSSAPPAPFVFRADHPFLFLICDKQTGSILFTGRVVRPGK